MLSGEAQQLSQDWNQFRSSLSDNSLDSEVYFSLSDRLVHIRSRCEDLLSALGDFTRALEVSGLSEIPRPVLKGKGTSCSSVESALDAVLTEIVDWHDIANIIAPILGRVAEVGRTPLLSVDISVVRKSLEELMQLLHDVPPRLASYPSCSY